MVVTIATIVAFQVYWLQRNYGEEKRLLAIRTNLLFRESLFKMQAAMLTVDTAVSVSSKHGRDTGQSKADFGMLKKVIDYKLLRDTPGMGNRGEVMIVAKSHDSNMEFGKVDTSKLQLHFSNVKFNIRVLGLDSLQKPLPVEDINAQLRKEFDREKLNIAFRVTRTPVSPENRDLQPPPEERVVQLPLQDIGNRPTPEDRMVQRGAAFKTFLKTGTAEIGDVPTDNRVTLGFKNRFVYQLDLDGVAWFILRKIGPQILFSLVLVLVTVLSFVLLYRNWQQQKRLTQAKNDFISNITHELKTPIATVSVAVEALRNFNALEDPERTQEYLAISAGELQRLSLLVDKVLKLSLFEKEEIELKKEAFNLKELVEEVAASMRLQFEKYQAKLQIEPEAPDAADSQDFSLRADRLHITSVVYNLLDNALKYSRHQPFVRVGLRSESERLVLSVADNGIGIPPAYRDKIFEKFFRVPTGDRHNVKGYGLGLSYVAYVLERQGGEISVESEFGVGSRFIVKIPRDHG
jgi:two-component system phosphate regulon sensor histidine kinase PhoR